MTPPSETPSSTFETTQTRILLYTPSPPAREVSPPRRTASAAWWWVPWLLFLLGTLSIFATQSPMGYVWDESYYFEPAHKAGRWLERALERDSVFDRASIDEYWLELNEHPSIQKFLSGTTLRKLGKELGSLNAVRFPMAFLFGGTLALLYLLGRRAWSPAAGLAAALAYAAMPRVFAHAHFATIEPVLMFGTVALVYCFVRGTESVGWAVASGIMLGVLLATKINAFFFIPPLVLWAYVYARKSAIHLYFFCIVLSPILFVSLWPWLWHDTANRILDYFRFHAQHQVTALWFMGQKWGYGGADAPWFYPSVMIGVTTPLTILALSSLGLLGTLSRLRSKPLPMLFLLMGLTCWLLASAPGVPKYDGVRLFLPLFPFLALMVGGGVDLLIRIVARLRNDSTVQRKFAQTLAIILLSAITLDGLFGALGAYPYLLSYFNPAVGGIKGAEARGFETTYWGDALNDTVFEVLNDPKVIPPNASIRVLALHQKNFEHLQDWGKIRPDIRFDAPPPYYAHLLLWRRGFFTRPELALADSPLFRRIHTWELDGVPILSLHRTGIEFENYWPRLAPDGTLLPITASSDSTTGSSPIVTESEVTTATLEVNP